MVIQMANKKIGIISYTLTTIASICFVGGLLVLTGGEDRDRTYRDVYIDNRRNA